MCPVVVMPGNEMPKIIFQYILEKGDVNSYSYETKGDTVTEEHETKQQAVALERLQQHPQ